MTHHGRDTNALTAAFHYGLPVSALLYLLLYWLCGCGSDVPACPLPDEQVAIVAAADAWSEVPYTLAGCDLESLRSYEAPDANAFAFLCASTPPHHCQPNVRCAYACYVADQANPSYPAGQLIVYAPGLSDVDRTAVTAHESMHAFGACSGRGQDYEHADPAVWGAGGALARSQAFLVALGEH